MHHSRNFIKLYLLLLLAIYIADGHLLTAIRPANDTTDCCACNSTEINSKLDNLVNICAVDINKFKTELRELKKNFATNSTCDHESEILAIISNIKENDTSNAVKSFLNLNDRNNDISRIVNDSYANSVANFENILNFIGALPTLTQRGIAYTSLLTQMKSNNHLNNPQILTLGFWIKEISNFFNYAGVLTTELEHNKFLFEKLKDALPEVVKRLLWEPVCLKQNYLKQYLFVENSISASRRTIYTLLGGNKAGSGGVWKFESLDGKTFKIINDYYNEYSYISSDADSQSSSYRYIFTSKEAEPTEWKLSVQDVNNNLITIKENSRNEYMYAYGAVFDATKRYVFTYRSVLATPNTYCPFEVVCC